MNYLMGVAYRIYKVRLKLFRLNCVVDELIAAAIAYAKQEGRNKTLTFVVPLWKRFTKPASRNEVTEGDACRHRKKYPAREESVQERELSVAGERRHGPGSWLRTSARLAALVCDDRRQRSAFQSILRRRAASLGEARSVCQHRLVFFQPIKSLPENLGRPDVRRHDDAVMHPLALAPRFDDSGIAQVRQMPRDLRLRAAQYLHEVADANFLIAHRMSDS